MFFNYTYDIRNGWALEHEPITCIREMPVSVQYIGKTKILMRLL